VKALAAAILMTAAAVPAWAAAPSIAGRWITEDGKALIEIARCGKAMCGRILRVLNPAPGSSGLDANNPDPARRSRPLAGLTILAGLTDAGDVWKGQIYDPKSGRTYASRVWTQGGALKVEGCWGPLCQTRSWKRTK
jgi:uncharacterized protein (DUF2147 family)